MINKTIVIISAALILCGSNTKLFAKKDFAPDNPNVILIYVDDLGYGDLSCYGATKVQTPNIDLLAKEGRAFTDAHTASAVCTPSRYALLTGEYPLRCGKSGTWGPLSHNSPLIINKDKLTLGQIFKDEGYSTACIGKWHLGFGEKKCDWSKPLRPGPLELGFDSYFGLPKSSSGIPFVLVENDRLFGWDPKDPIVFHSKHPSPTPKHPEKSRNSVGGAKKAHELYDDEKLGTMFTERGVRFIKKNKDNPFFLYFAPTNIHHPFTPAPRFIGTSQCGLYGDFIHELDWMVGELMNTLDDLKLKDKTMVIFTSDNGGMYNGGGKEAWKAGHHMNGHLLGFKFGAWEGGHRIPFIVRWPNHVKPSSKSDQLICSVDIMATMADLFNRELKADEAVDSYNIMEAIVGDPKKPIRDHLIVAAHARRNLTLRKDNWVYISGQGDGGGTLAGRGGPRAIGDSKSVNSDINSDGKVKKDAPKQQLYDLNQDPSQKVNIINEHPERAKEMALLLKQYRTQASTR